MSTIEVGLQGIFVPDVLISSIKPSPLNPRKHFDQTKLEELSDSIAHKGIIQPLVVREKGGDYEIVAGERRWRAAKMAKLKTVPVIIRLLDDKAVLELMTIENLQREDVYPVDEAVGYWRLVKEHGYTVKDLASKLGKTERYIQKRMSLTGLSDAWMKLLATARLPVGAGELIAPLPKDSQADLYEWNKFRIDTATQDLSVKDIRYEIQHRLVLQLKTAPFDIKDDKLLPVAGACTTCPKRSGNMPALFEDLEPDVCTDRKCFQAKQQASITLAVQQEPAIVQVSDAWSSIKPKDGVLKDGSYHTIGSNGNPKTDRCKYTQPAIVTLGHNIGKRIEICVAKDCKKHRDGEAHRANPYLEEQLQKQKDNKFKRALILALMKEVWQKVGAKAHDKSVAPLDDYLFRETVRQMWGDLNMHGQKAMALTVGLVKTSTKQQGRTEDSFTPGFMDLLAEVKSLRLHTLAMLMQAARRYEWCGVDQVKAWAEHAERWGVDCRAIERELKAEKKPARKKGDSKKGDKKK